jgi:hypothetical protein
MSNLYLGRQYDILALRGAAAVGDIELVQNLFDAQVDGEICVGIQKLAQRWVLEFCTELGSMRFRQDRGCRFMTDLRRGRLRTASDVFTSFGFSAFTITNNLQAEETTDMPADERFARAELLETQLAAGLVSIRVQVFSLADVDRKIILPLSTAA